MNIKFKVAILIGVIFLFFLPLFLGGCQGAPIIVKEGTIIHMAMMGGGITSSSTKIWLDTGDSFEIMGRQGFEVGGSYHFTLEKAPLVSRYELISIKRIEK